MTFTGEGLQPARPCGVSTWAGPVQVHRQEPVAKSTFLQHLDDWQEQGHDTLPEQELEEKQAALEAAARDLDAPEVGPQGWQRLLLCVPGYDVMKQRWKSAITMQNAPSIASAATQVEAVSLFCYC